MGLAAMNIVDAIKFKTYEWDYVRKTQRIRKLKITPQPTAAIFAFRTVQPTVPVIEVFRSVTGDASIDMKPENLVATAFNFIDAMLGNLFTEHKARMTGLAHGSRFHYRITASDGKYPSAVIVGTFATCSRNLSVTVRDVMVFNDGDPGLKASGELQFYLGFYFEQALIASREYDANIESGEVRDFPFGKGATLVTGQVPDTFNVLARGIEYDWFGDPIHGWWSPPAILPEALAAYENDLENVAEAMQSFEMPQAPGTYSLTLALKSGPRGIHYWINGRIDIDVLPPSEPPFVPFEHLVDFEDLEKIKRLALAGTGSRGGMGGGGKMHGFAIGPDDTLYMKRPDREWERQDDGAPMSGQGCACDFTAEMAIDNQDRIHVLTLRAGTLRHASTPAKGRGDPLRFRPLGDGVAHNPTVVAAEDGAYVLARDAEGALRVAPLTGAERGRWIALGGCFADAVTAHASRREIEIFGVTPEGQPIGGTWRIGSSRAPEWTPLGRGLGRIRLRHVDVIVAHARIHLLAMAEDRHLFTLTRSGEAWTGSWKDHGSLDTLFFEKPEARPKAAKQANGSARPMPRPRSGMGEGIRATA